MSWNEISSQSIWVELLCFLPGLWGLLYSLPPLLLFLPLYFFLICYLSVLSSGRRRWTLPRALSHSRSVRIYRPNFPEKVFLSNFTFCLWLALSSPQKYLTESRSVSAAAAAPNENQMQKKFLRCALQSAQPRMSILDYSAKLRITMSFHVRCQGF